MSLSAQHREPLAELAPVLRRAVGLDARSLVRFRLGDGRATALVRLPFGVLVSRGVHADVGEQHVDATVAAGQALAWIDGERADPPAARDADWRGGVPPAKGWTRVDRVPDDVIRPLVRSGALTLKQAAEREGVPGAQPRAEVTDTLLDSVVLTVTDDAGTTAEVTLRAVSALTRMGFLPKGGHAFVDVAGRWIRLVGEYGSVYRETATGGLSLA